MNVFRQLRLRVITNIFYKQKLYLVQYKTTSPKLIAAVVSPRELVSVFQKLNIAVSFFLFSHT